MFKLLSIKCSEELAIKLLVIPPDFFEHENYDQLPECITSQICPDVLKQYVVEQIHTGKWNRFTAPGLIQYCKDNKITECKTSIIEYILNKDLNGGYIYPALDYLGELYGVGTMLSDVLPACDDDELLSELSARIPNDISSALLDQKLWKAYRKKNESRWLIALIKHNNVDALREYYKKAKELMSLPDMIEEPCVPEITVAIRDVTLSSCISVLVDLFVLAFDTEFKDRDGFGLRNSCWKALKAIAEKEYGGTREALLSAMTDEDLAANTALRDLCNEIENEHKYVQDEPLDFEFAKVLVMNA